MQYGQKQPDTTEDEPNLNVGNTTFGEGSTELHRQDEDNNVGRFDITGFAGLYSSNYGNNLKDEPTNKDKPIDEDKPSNKDEPIDEDEPSNKDDEVSPNESQHSLATLQVRFPNF